MLLDLYGRPMKRPSARNMREELSGPSMGSVRQILSGHPADNLRPERLAAILRQAEVNDPTEFLQMAEQFEEKDLHYAAVLGVRKRAVRKMEFAVEPGDDSPAAQDAAEMVRATLEGQVVRTALIDIMDALGKGFSVHEIIWNTRTMPWKVAGLKYRDPAWFRFDQVDGETLRYRDNGGDQDMPAGRFIVHRAKTKSGLTIRGGLARLAAWAYIFKNYSLRDWAIFLTTYGHPMRIGRYDSTASDEDKRTLLRALRQVGTDMAGIMPRSMEVEFVKAAVTGGEEMFERSARYWDEQLSKGILGQVATTDAIAGGHAVGKIHEAVREDIRDADAEQLAATLQRDIALPLTAWNFGPSVPCPNVSLVSPEDHDPRMLLAAAREFGPRGLRVPVSLVRDRCGIPAPEDDEEVLDYAPASASSRPTAAPVAGIAAASATVVPLQRPHETAFDRLGDDVDAGLFDQFTDPMIAGFVEALQGARTIEEARDILADLAIAAPPDTVVEFMARMAFGARLAGETGADIEA